MKLQRIAANKERLCSPRVFVTGGPRSLFPRRGRREESSASKPFAEGLLTSSPTRRRAGFTLIELLAALAVMAMVMPAAMKALAIANRAGQVAQRKVIAARVADRMLSEYVAASQNTAGKQKGTVSEGAYNFDWNIRLESWREDTMRLVTCEVTYPVQGQQYNLAVSTLISPTQ